jgi:transcriptional regulator GlxA family with amidase domain
MAAFTVVFALFPNLTQLDFTGPYEVFASTPGVTVVVASEAGGEVRADKGLSFAGTARLADVDTCDLLCIPGGFGTNEALANAAFMAQVKRLAAAATYVTSVCTGSLVLAAAGLLRGKRAASHWFWRDRLAAFGASPDPARVVRDGSTITGGGVTAGIDFALTVVAEVFGPETAQAIQLSIEYAPQPPFDSGRPETAPPQVLEQVSRRYAKFAEPRDAGLRTAAAALAGEAA